MDPRWSQTQADTSWPMAKGTKKIVNRTLQEAQLCLWRGETVEVSLYLASKHQTQIQVVHVAYRNVPLVCVCG